MTNPSNDGSPSRSIACKHAARMFVCAIAPLTLGACSSSDQIDGEAAVAHEAVTNANCGYAVRVHLTGVTRKGFQVSVTVSNTSHKRLQPFSLLIDAGSAKLVRIAHGTYKKTNDGYLISTVNPDRDPWDKEDAADLDDIRLGRTYRFVLQFTGAYRPLKTHVIAAGGNTCDTTAPTIKLNANGSLYTAAAKLTLSASAADNVAISKVVFSQDGVPVGTDTSAPYSVTIPVTSSLNGRHTYAATAYDLSGNQATESKRVLVAIGNKFFGTAATTSADYPNLLKNFNQLTPGNAGKWGSVEAVQDQMNWGELDTAYNFAKSNHIPFKFHTLVWGQQQPAWLSSLTPDQQLEQLEEWMAAVAERYPDIDLIDVVNEPLHAPPSYAAALGGAGETGWDWVIKAFEMARRHFPKAELILNDYSVLLMSTTTQSYLALIDLLNERGLIDGIGEQGHFYERAPEPSVLTDNFNALVSTGLPIYISELDLNFADDARQANRMRDLFSLFWSTPSVLGVTHWGYLQNNMWQTNAYLVRSDGTDRPALTWLQCYRAGRTDCTVPAYVPQPRTGDAGGIVLEAEEYDSAQGLLPAGTVIGYASDGAWAGYSQVTFNDNWDALRITYAQGNTNTPNLSVHLGSLGNTAVSTIPLAPTGGWGTTKTVTIPWAPVSGTQDVFVRFNGGGANVDKLEFVAPAGVGPNLVADGDFEQGTAGSWWSWGGGTISNTTARALSGIHSLAMTDRTGNSPLVQTLTSKVSRGKTYRASLWATIAGASSSAYVTTVTQCANQEPTYARLGGWDNTQTLTEGTWSEFSGDLLVPDCDLTNVGLWLEGPGSGVDFYIDHASVRPLSSANVLPNGTFESGSDGWYTWNGGTVSVSNGRAHGGASSLLVSGRASNAPAATDITSLVKDGRSYPLSLWVSVEDYAPDISTKSINVTQATSCTNSDGTTSTSYAWIVNPVTVSSGNSWTLLSGAVTIPSSCVVSQVQIFVEGGAGADLYIDDVQLIDNVSGPTNLLTDGTFESGQGNWFGWGQSSLSVAGVSHSGTQSLMASGMSNGAIARDATALVSGGKKYTASAWVTVGSLAAGSGQVRWQAIKNCDSDASDSYPWLTGPVVAAGEWQQVTGTIDLSTCTQVNKLYLFAGADSGDVYIDDVVLTAL